MEDHKSFFKKKSKAKSVRTTRHNDRAKDGRVHIAMHSNIFSEVKHNLIASNSMYADLLNDIQASVEPYSTKEKITIDLYETEKTDEFTKDSVIVGFRKYVNGCLYSLRKQHLFRFSLFGSFLLIGILIEFILYGVIGYGNMSDWVFKSIEVLGTLFIWQFGGYLAFEFLGEMKNIYRYKQALEIEFNVRQWD